MDIAKVARSAKAAWAPATCALAGAALLFSVVAPPEERAANPEPARAPAAALDARARADLETRLWRYLGAARAGDPAAANAALGLHPDAPADVRRGRALAPLVALADEALGLVIGEAKDDSARVSLRLISSMCVRNR